MWGNSCEFCGREHDLAKRENCPTFGRSCNKCGKKNHFANVCFGHAPKPTTRTHPVYCFEDELSDEVFGVEEISAVTLDDSQLVTLKRWNLEIIFIFSPIPELRAMLSLCIYTRKPLRMLICAM